MDVRERLGRRVKALREEKGWSQEAFADHSGLHRTYVSGIERGVRNPTLTVLEKLARGLEVPIAGLLELESASEPRRRSRR